jgi:hypothetical protein
MTIKRCDKCGKAFMSESEVDRHKMYEHPVPVSPMRKDLHMMLARITVI